MNKRNQNKISVLMPAYNDAGYISQSIHSVLEQTYPHWELIIIDDGSTDNTAEIIKGFKDKRIKYIYQQNADQLNALANGSKYITGDIVVLFHSDDLLVDENVFTSFNEYFLEYSEYNGFYADYIKIDKNGHENGRIKVYPFLNKSIIKTILLNRGSNPVGDHFVIKKEFFNKYIFPNYIRDNTIYYIDYSETEVLKLKKVSPWYRYRVYEENYIHSEVGKFVVLNGKFRTIYKLLLSGLTITPKLFYNEPALKIMKKLRLNNLFGYRRLEKIDWKFALKYFTLWRKELIKRNYNEITILLINKIIDSINCRIENKKNHPLRLSYLNEKIYYGKDARIFFKDYEKNVVNSFYTRLLNNNYDHIIVPDQESKNSVEEVLKFFSLFYEVEVGT